jgi:CUB/sushi domain-containing protein
MFFCVLQPFVKNCGGNLSGPSGTILSPNYPNNYGNNIYCEWTITARPGASITLKVNTFLTEYEYDRLFILRPGTCQPVNPAALYWSGRQQFTLAVGQDTVAIYFYADGSISTKGFNITWTY